MKHRNGSRPRHLPDVHPAKSATDSDRSSQDKPAAPATESAGAKRHTEHPVNGNATRSVCCAAHKASGS